MCKLTPFISALTCHARNDAARRRRRHMPHVLRGTPLHFAALTCHMRDDAARHRVHSRGAPSRSDIERVRMVPVVRGHEAVALLREAHIRGVCSGRAVACCAKCTHMPPVFDSKEKRV
eukprot:1159821-Pelagomonas_calceolata.AAC.5